MHLFAVVRYCGFWVWLVLFGSWVIRWSSVEVATTETSKEASSASMDDQVKFGRGEGLVRWRLLLTKRCIFFKV